MRIQHTITSKNGQEEQIYTIDANEKAKNIPQDKCYWEFLTDKLVEQLEVPAVILHDVNDYQISRQALIDRSKKWAKAFYNAGVKDGEVIPFYGLNSPDMAAAAGGLNLINAVPYFLRPGISKTAIQDETKDCRTAVVFWPMLPMTEEAFTDFERIIVVTVYDWLQQPLKTIVKHKLNDTPIIQGNLISVDDFLKGGKRVSNETIADIKHHSDGYAMITSSSGTTNKDVNKGIIATNGSIIANLLQTSSGGLELYYGRKCLCRGPFAFSTVVNVSFLLPLYMGQTIISYLKPDATRIVEDIIQTKTNVIMCTGSHWDFFFRKVQAMIDEGNIPDLSFIDAAIIGGDSTTPTKIMKWNTILQQCQCKFPIFCGYGLSETFATVSVGTIRVQPENFAENEIISVGFPMPGVDLAILSEDGKIIEDPSPEERGELLINCKSIMPGYYNRPEETSRVFIYQSAKAGSVRWLKTGDLAHIDTDGRIYIWGRREHNLTLEDKTMVHPSDISAKLCKHPEIENAVVFLDQYQLSIHLDTECETESIQSHINLVLDDVMPNRNFNIVTHYYPNGFPLDTLSTKTDYDGMKNKV